MSRELSILYVALAVIGVAIFLIALVKILGAIRSALSSGRLGAGSKEYSLSRPLPEDTRFSLALSQEWQRQSVSERGGRKTQQFQGTLLQRIRGMDGGVSHGSQQMISSLIRKTNSTRGGWGGAKDAAIDPNDPKYAEHAEALQSALDVAERFNREGKYDEAVANYTAALEMHPNFLPALFGRGFVYTQMRRDVEALVDLSNAIMLSPEQGMFYAPRSLALMRLGRIQEATRDLERFFKYSELSPTAVSESEVVVAQMKTLLRVDGYDFDERISSLTKPLLDELRHSGELPEAEFNRKIAQLVTQLLDDPQDERDDYAPHS